MNLKSTPFLEVPTINHDIKKDAQENGSIYLYSDVALKRHPERITERLEFWAKTKPDTVFLGQRNKERKWKTISYDQAWLQVQSLAQYLLNSGLSVEKPMALLSGNSIEHGLLALAALHIGIPYAPISPAYATKSEDFTKLKHCVDLLTPAVVFVQDGQEYAHALHSVINEDVRVIAVENVSDGQESFKAILDTEVSSSVESSYENVTADTYAKIMFSSGSTGLPKGVINTHGNITTNWQQITQTFQFITDTDFEIVLIDWLPWNHVYGGNHNFGISLYNGGSLYIDEGNPTPKGLLTTIRNLNDIAPTIYFNVPRGFEELVNYLKTDKVLRSFFFSRLKMLFYAGASMPQHIWDDLEMLAYNTIGKRILISAGMGMTEASPTCLLNTKFGSGSGQLGVPVPGIELKLVPYDGKLEARFKGGNITPGYWRNPEMTAMAFDDEGFYKSGDALKLIDENNPNEGLLFDGRIVEDFKLDSGTWVSVGVIKGKLIKEGKGFIQDAVITGQDHTFLGAIIFPELTYCKKLIGIKEDIALNEIIKHPLVIDQLQETLNRLAENSVGSSTCVRRAILANFAPSKDKGEITEKGSMNQRILLKNNTEMVDALYNNELLSQVIEIDTDYIR